MKIPHLIPNSLLGPILTLSAAHATIIPYAAYHLGEADSLEAGTNKPQDSSGNARHFISDINGSGASTGNASFHPAAVGSTAYLDTSSTESEGWYSNGTFSNLPTDNFAFGVFARAAASTDDTRGDVFTVGGGNGCFKISLESEGWAASSHNVAWIGDGGGSAGSFQADTWVHLAVIRSGGVTTFYIDGVAQGSTYSGAPVHGAPHLSVRPGGSGYFDGHIDEAKVVTFSAGETTANILTALQQDVVPTSFVNVGLGATFTTANLSTDEASTFRLGGAIADSAVVTVPDGFTVVAGTAPKHIIHITQEGEIPTGSYPLIYYTGSIGGLGFSGLQLAPLPGRIAGSLVNNTVDATIDLVVTGSEAGDITWKGSSGGTWDVEGNSNWVFTGSSVSTKFFAGDKVLLDDTAATTAITISEPVTPSSVVIDNTTKNYSFSGAGIGGSSTLDKFGTGMVTFTNSNSNAGGMFFDGGTVRIGDGGSTGSLGSGPLTNNSSLIINRSGTLEMPNSISGNGTIEKSGTGVVTLSGSNSFTGAVTVTAGTIISGNSDCLGDISAGTTVSAGATLDTSTSGFGDEPIVINGSGVGGLGVIVNNSGGNLFGVQNVTLGSNSTIGGTGRWDLRGEGSVLAGDFKLTKTGSNQISLVLASVTVKDIDLNEGLLGIEYGANVDNSNPGTITVNGGTLGFGTFFNPITCTKPIVLNGGAINTTAGGEDGDATVASTVGLAAASNTINVQDGATLTFDGVVSGSGALVKTGTGTLSFTAASAYTGATTVSAGTLSLAASGLADPSTVDISGTGVLNLGFSGTDSVLALFIDGVQQPAGVYGSAHSSGRFAGSGTLTVTSGPSGSSYSNWETANGIAGAGATADPDGDGISNGIEFVIGGDPSGPNSNSGSLAPTIASDSTYLNFVFRRTDESASTVPFVQYGSTLSGWTAAANGVNGVIVQTDNDFHGAGTDRVTVRIPIALASGAKLFARLQVNIP
jgi:autotransporter-associated beta strand protein